MKLCSCRKGSIALETVITLPLFLFFACSILQYLVAAGCISHLRNAADNAACETALLMTAAETAGAGNAAGSWILDQIKDPEVAERLRDFGTRLLFEVFFEERMNHWMAECGSSLPERQLLEHFSVCIESTLTGEALFARVDYRMTLLWRKTQGAVDVLIPYFPLSGSAMQGRAAKDDAVWEMDNFSRGRIFRIRNGGNLPMGYPVIASFREGVATSIRSMDITAPSLKTEVRCGLNFVKRSMRCPRLRERQTMGKESIVIHRSEIRRRVLLLILPENPVGECIEEQLNQAVSYAGISGVEMAVLRQGVSRRFE
jgi:hypothetical protein